MSITIDWRGHYKKIKNLRKVEGNMDLMMRMIMMMKMRMMNRTMKMMRMMKKMMKTMKMIMRAILDSKYRNNKYNLHLSIIDNR